MQGHIPLPSNPTQPEDAEIRDEPDAVAVDVGASGADAGESAGVELLTARDSEDSDPLRIKRNRSSSTNERDATSGGGDFPPPALSPVPCPSATAPKRRRFRKLLRTHTTPAGCVWLLLSDSTAWFGS